MKKTKKIILHLDMDAFFASVEQAAHPEYKGKPLLVGSRGRKLHTVVAACSYEAKAFGIHSGMPTGRALRLCPWACFVPADTSKYVYTSEKIEDLLKNYSDRMERASIDEFYLDLSSCRIPEVRRISGEIKRRIKDDFSITASIGAAPAKIISKMAAKSVKPDGSIILEEKDVAAFLEDLPVEAIPGIGPQFKARLNNMSVFTIGQLRMAGVRELSRAFGKSGLWMSMVSRGEDNEEVRLWREEEAAPKSISHAYTLEREVAQRPELLSWIRMLSEMVGQRLRREKLEATVSGVSLRGRDEHFSREKNFQSATSDPQRIYERSILILESFRLGDFPVRALEVRAGGLVPEQKLYLFPQERKRESLLQAVDKINNRLGEWAIYPAAISRVKN